MASAGRGTLAAAQGFLSLGFGPLRMIARVGITTFHRFAEETKLFVALFIAGNLLAGCEQSPKAQATNNVSTPSPQTSTAAAPSPMALMPAGEFMMGDNAGDEDEKPAHKVQLGAFYMDRHEVTQNAYERLMEKNPSKARGPDKPV